MNVAMTMGLHLDVIQIIRIEGNVSIIVTQCRNALPLLNNCYLIFIHAKVGVILQQRNSFLISIPAGHDTKRELFARFGISRLEGEYCFYVELDVRCFGGKLGR